MKVVWAILCERVVIDTETNNLSLINVVEEVHVPAQPPGSLPEAVSKNLVPGLLELVVLWARSDAEIPERGLGRVRIVTPAVGETIANDFDVDLSRFLRLRSRLKLPGLPPGGEGTYLFKIGGKPAGGEWTELFELPLRMVLQAQESD